MKDKKHTEQSVEHGSLNIDELREFFEERGGDIENYVFTLGNDPSEILWNYDPAIDFEEAYQDSSNPHELNG